VSRMALRVASSSASAQARRSEEGRSKVSERKLSKKARRNRKNALGLRR
jgi:hypothetical protein